MRPHSSPHNDMLDTPKMIEVPLDILVDLFEWIFRTEDCPAKRLSELRSVSKDFSDALDLMWKSLFTQKKCGAVRLLRSVENRVAIQALMKMTLNGHLEVDLKSLTYRTALLKLENLGELAKSALVIGNGVSGSLRLFKFDPSSNSYKEKLQILPGYRQESFPANDGNDLTIWTQDSELPPVFSNDGLRLVWLQQRRLFSCFVDGTDLISIQLLDTSESVEKIEFVQSEPNGRFCLVLEQASVNSYISVCDMETLQIAKIAAIPRPEDHRMILGRGSFSKDARHVAIVSSSLVHSVHVFKNPFVAQVPFPRHVVQRELGLYSFPVWHNNSLIVSSPLPDFPKGTVLKLVNVETNAETLHCEVLDTTGCDAESHRASLTSFCADRLVFLHYTTLVQDSLLLSCFKVNHGMAEFIGSQAKCWYRCSSWLVHPKYPNLRLLLVLGSLVDTRRLSRTRDVWLWDGVASLNVHQFKHSHRAELNFMETLIRGAGGAKAVCASGDYMCIVEGGHVYVRYLAKVLDSFSMRQPGFGWGPIPTETPTITFPLVFPGTACSFSPI